MILFGIRKLKISLSELNDMPWNEFELNSFAFWEEEEQRIEELQYLAWRITIAPHLEPKSLPKTFNQFIGKKEEVKIDQGALDFFETEMKKFKELQENGRT